MGKGVGFAGREPRDRRVSRTHFLASFEGLNVGKRGPVGQTVTELKLHGQFRKDRHGKRAEEEAKVAGEPVKPDHLKGRASKCWDRLLPMLIKIGRVGSIDADILTAVCVQWADYLAAKKPSERRAAYLVWQSAMKELGLSPASRARIPAEVKVDNKPAGLSAFARKRG